MPLDTTCRTCKFWGGEERYKWDNPADVRGLMGVWDDCTMVTSGEPGGERRARADNGGGLVTRYDFGCVEHSPKGPST